MRRLTKLIVLATVAAGLSVAPATATSEATTPRGALLNQIRLFNAGNWPALYRTFTRRVRARCPYRTFVAQAREGRANVGRLGVRNIRVRRTGNRAALTYQNTARGVVFLTVTRRHPDIYVRIGDRWYDEVDSVTSC
jgi:hypothetical protein